jgi:hypothetical protein
MLILTSLSLVERTQRLRRAANVASEPTPYHGEFYWLFKRSKIRQSWSGVGLVEDQQE